MKVLLKNHPVASFYVLAFLFSWLGWVPQALQARGMFPFDHPALTILFTLLGGGGPTFAAIILMLILKGKSGPGELFAALGNFRAGWAWYLVAFLGMPLITAVALSAGWLFGQPLPDFAGFAWVSILPMFIGMAIWNVWEEIGWRGFALPRLQEKHSALITSIVMSILWTLWHLPLLLNPSNPMSGLALGGEFLFSFGLTVIYTWLYNNTQGSLFFVTVFHAMSNTVAAVLLDRGVFVSSYLAVVGVTFAAGVIIPLSFGAKRFAR